MQTDFLLAAYTIIMNDPRAVRRRKNKSKVTVTTVHPSATSNHEPRNMSANTEEDTEAEVNWFLKTISFILGVSTVVILGYIYARHINTLHENQLWFSNLKEVEREISFRTEAGLYYSFFKQMVEAPSFSQGLYDLAHDNVTEHLRTINILERFNVYQEVIVCALYKFAPIKIEPIFFYIYSVFFLHGLLICAIYSITWLLSRSWIAGALTALFYIFNRFDTTRVEYTIPLRESFALPFLWGQIAALTYYLSAQTTKKKKIFSLCVITLCTFFFALTWQFAQFILLLQAMALFGVVMLDIIPMYKVRSVYTIQLFSLLSVCLLQFLNKMIISSLVLSFIPAAYIVFFIKGDVIKPCGIVLRILKVLLSIVLVFFFTAVINVSLKGILQHEADEHIFKFVAQKLGLGDWKDFDSQLYLCTGAFNVLPSDTYERLTTHLVFPFYVVTHFTVLVFLAMAVLQNWKHFSSSDSKDDAQEEVKEGFITSPHILSQRPELAFHAVQTVFFALMAISTMRFKYLWTVYMCIMASVGICDFHFWKKLLSKFRIEGIVLEITRNGVTIIVLAALLIKALPPVLKNLEDLKEFYDPDTVDLMEWIKKDTAPTAAFTGSMQLLAGVKLCTGRPLTNHPHYEDKQLRERTKELYQYYGRTPPDKVHEIMLKYDVSYIILEDSICLAQSTGCRVPDLIDVLNGEIPDHGRAEERLKRSDVPRFCNEIRYSKPHFTKNFKLVFSNRTFRVYKVLGLEPSSQQ
ncbi:protein C-mannosyl-transferase DPY19L3-like isoform X2 [Lineus longissimus]|uniref:protein C-mannosyl-transferase DPY19L3-like isoform X2 n=1 Tax=Lineus longissimus TaxID=88925 RepID=UPI00315C4D8B